MKNQCPKCSGTATITQGRFRDITNAKLDTDYTDGIRGMVSGVKIICPACGEINLFLSDWHSLIRKEINTEDISRFQQANPNFRGVIPFNSWLNSLNDESVD